METKAHTIQVVSFTRLTYDSMEGGEQLVLFRQLIIGIEYPESPGVLKRMHGVAELVQHATQSPYISFFIDGMVAIQVNHFRRSIHGSSVSMDLKRQAH